MFEQSDSEMMFGKLQLFVRVYSTVVNVPCIWYLILYKCQAGLHGDGSLFSEIPFHTWQPKYKVKFETDKKRKKKDAETEQNTCAYTAAEETWFVF